MNESHAEHALSDRRYNLTLRQHFAAARDLLAPILDGAEIRNGTTLYRAMHELHRVFPSLSVGETEALIAAVVRSVRIGESVL